MTRNEMNMDARDFFQSLVSTDVNCPVDRYADKFYIKDLYRFAEAYHKAKVKEIMDKVKFRKVDDTK